MTRRFRAPSHSCLKDSARLTSAYHHWISGVGLPTTSQYSSKASPVSLVSDMGDLTNPARGRGSRNAVTGQSEKKKNQQVLIVIPRLLLCRARAPGRWASEAAAHRLGSCGSRTPKYRLTALVHRLSCSMPCGIFPDQESNLCPLHWQLDCLPLSNVLVRVLLKKKQKQTSFLQLFNKAFGNLLN